MTNDIKTGFDSEPSLNIHSEWLANFVDVYQQLSTNNLHLLSTIYHKNINFKDPMHELHGFSELSKYFEGLYQNVSSCQFRINHVIEKQTEAAIYWQMVYQHKHLNSGKKITVSGSSQLKSFDNKVIYHRDYIDLGEMLYQRLPVIGRLITWIKNRAANA
ncbi:nuclear transport factor 2 family protein [Psychrosphaera sp. F3M07]|jgi:hypothetical protein|uniref:nuclear transport factor 2 family protein n=1 Tax=Psychrosphaera sp. F3M07 TaxID=2841560 RepID=UPI001C085349|nr:nuclear transport factor 2 family protein [Psychrosphaera sp. F3M07]MBU2918883.1 nuclear transport factor 2 family protein [Psychrosphaera sp. F3M07]